MPEHTNKIFNIHTLNQISPTGLACFPSDYYQINKHNVNPDAILTRSYNMLEMDIPESVVAIGRAGAGTNNIPVDNMSLRGIPVFNTPGANANAVKELVLAGILLASRNLVPALQFVDGLQGDDTALHKQAENKKKQFSGIELPGRTLGIIGLGKIGRLVAKVAIELGMKVIGYDPKITIDAAWHLPASVRKAQSIEDLLQRSDFITLHVPLLDATNHLINAESIGIMKQDAILLNFSRSAIVDEDAVITNINNNKLKYYVCDFPSQKLLHHNRVIILPHLGASTLEAEENCSVMVAHQLIDYLQHGNITNTVNFPDVIMERESPYRIAVANTNTPNLLGQISTNMANADLNIHNMTNKSRDAIAYTLVDVDSPIPQQAIDNITAISGVLMARYLPVPTE